MSAGTPSPSSIWCRSPRSRSGRVAQQPGRARGGVSAIPQIELIVVGAGDSTGAWLAFDPRPFGRSSVFCWRALAAAPGTAGRQGRAVLAVTDRVERAALRQGEVRGQAAVPLEQAARRRAAPRDEAAFKGSAEALRRAATAARSVPRRAASGAGPGAGPEPGGRRVPEVQRAARGRRARPARAAGPRPR